MSIKEIFVFILVILIILIAAIFLIHKFQLCPNTTLITTLSTLAIALLTFIIVVQNLYRPSLKISALPYCRKVLFHREYQVWQSNRCFRHLLLVY